MQQRYSNNAVSTISAALAAADTSFTTNAPAGGGYSPFQLIDTGSHIGFEMATLTHPDTPGVYEIIKITAHDPYSFTFTVERGQEGTTAINWPIGVQISGRVTAGMLERMVQNENSDKYSNALTIGMYYYPAKTPSGDGVSIRAESRNIQQGWVIGGFPVVQIRDEHTSGNMTPVLGMECVVPCFTMDLGVVPAWAASTNYRYGDVVRPATPNGAQYRLWAPDGSENYSPGTQPTFTTADTQFSPDPGIDPSIIWIPSGAMNDWHDFNVPINNVKFFPTEFGFICRAYSGTTPPTVSIAELTGGTVVTPPAFASAVSMTGITGPNTRHRFTGFPDIGCGGFSVRLDTPAAGGTCVGMFYAKGIFVQTGPA